MESPTEADREKAASSNGFSSQERKRYRKERRATDGGKAAEGASDDTDYADFSRIPTSLELLTKSMRTQLSEIAASAGSQELHKARVPSAAVPTFKVGTLEMYKRFPEAYEAFMDRHDCTKVREYLFRNVVDRIVRSNSADAPNPFPVHVADFGCGTGRIDAMVAQHPSVKGIYAYDNETAMLRRCLLNTVRAAALSGTRTGVRVLPTASRAKEPSSKEDEKQLQDGLFAFSGAQPAESNALEVVVRPCPYQSLQAGFLSKTEHRKCQLVVCAWSLSYLMRLQWGEARWHAAVDAVIQELIQLLDAKHSDAAIVIIETLGNGTDTPTRSNRFTQRLEETHGFVRQWVRTDYTFESMEEAGRMTRFFFGEKVAQQLERSTEGVNAEKEVVLMECTGIWTLWKLKGA